MKILALNTLYPPNVRGGAERSVQLLAEALVRAGIDVTIVSTDQEAREPTVMNGVKVLTLALANIGWPFGDAVLPPLRRKLWHVIDAYNPFMQVRVAEALEGERPDIVHTNNLQGISVAAWRAATVHGVPVVHTLRDYYLSCARASRFHAGQNCARTCLTCAPFLAIRRRASRVVAAAVGPSRFILQRHIELGLFSAASVRAVIVNPAEAFQLDRRAHEAVVFGVLGRLEEVKGVDQVVQAFAQRDTDGWQLLIAGTGPAAVVDRLRHAAAQARRPQQIHFLGWTDRLDFLSRVDVVVVPSLWHEPFSRSAIEAQVNGVAVIAANRGGLPDIVEDEVTGLLFEPDQPTSLGEKIDRILGHPGLIRQFGAAGGRAGERFDADRIAAEYVRCYEAAIAAR